MPMVLTFGLMPRDVCRSVEAQAQPSRASAPGAPLAPRFTHRMTPSGASTKAPLSTLTIMSSALARPWGRRLLANPAAPGVSGVAGVTWRYSCPQE